MRGTRTTIVAFVLFMTAVSGVISKTVGATGTGTPAARQAQIERGAHLVRTMPRGVKPPTTAPAAPARSGKGLESLR